METVQSMTSWNAVIEKVSGETNRFLQGAHITNWFVFKNCLGFNICVMLWKIIVGLCVGLCVRVLKLCEQAFSTADLSLENNINDCSFLFKSPSKPWQWTSMNTTRSLKLNESLTSLFTTVLFLLWHVKMSAVERDYEGRALNLCPC